MDGNLLLPRMMSSVKEIDELKARSSMFSEPMIPCRIVSDVAEDNDAAIPLSIYNPETNTTEKAALVVDLTVREKVTATNATGKQGTEAKAVKEEIKPENYGSPPVSFPPSLPVPRPMDGNLLLPRMMSSVKEIDELKASQTVGVYFGENGEVQLLDEKSDKANDTPDDMNAALWNAYLTGLYNGLSLVSGEVRPGHPLLHWNSALGLPPLPKMGPPPFNLKRKGAFNLSATTLFAAKKGRRAKYLDRSCKNCGTKTTPFWRKDRLSGQPLCNACGLYLSKNDDHRPASLWQNQPTSRP